MWCSLIPKCFFFFYVLFRRTNSGSAGPCLLSNMMTMRLVSRPHSQTEVGRLHTCWGVTIYYKTLLSPFNHCLYSQTWGRIHHLSLKFCKTVTLSPKQELLLFMPTEQSQVEYYHYYRASQRRVQQWVQNTSRELEAGHTTSRSSSSDLPLIQVVGESKDAAAAAAEGGNSSSGLRRREGSRRRSSSSSKRQIHDQVDRTSRSREPSSGSRSTRTRKKGKTNDVRSRKPYSSDGLTTSSLLSLGLFPLIFVLTPPSVATLFSATILLAGYFSVDYRVSIHKFYYFLRLISLISFRRKSRFPRNCNRRGRHGIRFTF